ncbi:malate synthase G [Candidatus Endobugula sertula]|uniref:Malate synthase G n=1 Tax=Candidatus Endobugula sertula TaxID=62101 RepID=A0A1D2QLI9_9GAMM|nr:malate synthase G [Candidatus Endobugula sertula]
MSTRQGLTINSEFRQFIEGEVLPLTSLNGEQFWLDVQGLMEEFMPINKALLAKRESLQRQIDDWHRNNDYTQVDIGAYKQFLTDIGYLVVEGDDFSIITENVDEEIAAVAAPQLVVPIKNARFALNAVNARWGSLYDALYSSDVIPKTGKLKPNGAYNALRGAEVIRIVRNFLDRHFPLESGSHHDVTLYQVYYQQLTAVLKDGTYIGLKYPKQFVAYNGPKNEPTELVFKNNGLHVEIRIAPNSEIGKIDIASIDDVRLEAALTTIMDCEDSVAAVDSEDKIDVYRNWMGLIRGDLSEAVTKGNKTSVREMKKDRTYTDKDGGPYNIRRRSLMFIRNVGHLMTTDTIKDSDGNDIPEGILDGIFTTLIGSLDIGKDRSSKIFNSQTDSIYIVKPKMHGPEEVKFTCDLLTRIEDILGLSQNTVKIGIMDEERRTTVNLKECIRMAKERCIFINTGFLDRTGDEIHTSMEAGAFLPKDKIKNEPWITAYENANVDIGLACGLQGKAQIGKGMWAMPDRMADMLKEKKAHPLSGANTAWVPSPTAAVLHALHYHQVDVFAEQDRIKTRTRASIDDILTLPLLTETLSEEAIMNELDNNVQGILGYVVRWIDQGIGCSKVPDINNVGLMEDRATLRISSQHIANWLHHAICTKEQVINSLKKMATIVDQQNTRDPLYKNMGPDFEQSIAFQAATDLIFKGRQQPSGYTEPLLHQYRRQAKAQ